MAVAGSLAGRVCTTTTHAWADVNPDTGSRIRVVQFCWSWSAGAPAATTGDAAPAGRRLATRRSTTVTVGRAAVGVAVGSAAETMPPRKPQKPMTCQNSAPSAKPAPLQISVAVRPNFARRAGMAQCAPQSTDAAGRPSIADPIPVTVQAPKSRESLGPVSVTGCFGATSCLWPVRTYPPLSDVHAVAAGAVDPEPALPDGWYANVVIGDADDDRGADAPRGIG